MPCCQEKRYNGWCRGEKTYIAQDGKEYCLFHAPSDLAEKTYKTIFNNYIFNHINSNNNRHVIRFNGVIFPFKIEFNNYNTNRPWTFRNCIFLDVVSFEQCEFPLQISFGNCTFEDIFNISYCKFEDDFKFFQNYCQMFGINDASINNSVIISKNWFIESFETSNLTAKDIFITDNSVLDSAKFSSISTTKRSYINNNIFSETLSISNSTFNDDIEISKLAAEELIIEDCTIKSKVIFINTDMNCLNLLTLPCNKLAFIACHWPQLNGHDVILDTIKFNHDKQK